MPRRLPRALTRIRTLAAAGRVVVTEKARLELEDLGLGSRDLLEILGAVSAADRPARLRSGPSQQWLYVLRPTMAGLRLYLKVAIRQHCVVISCHEDEAEIPEDADRER